jgi:6-phosphogluconolactonase
MNAPITVYVGTMDIDGPGDAGIHVFEFAAETATLRLQQICAAPAPSFLCMAPNNSRLYAVCRGEPLAHRGVGALYAFESHSDSGLLRLEGQARVPAHPAYVSTDRTGRWVLVACTFAGSIAVVPADPAVWSEPVEPIRHEGESLQDLGFSMGSQGVGWPWHTPFPHSIRAVPDNRFVLVPDLGLNRVNVYVLDAARGDLRAADHPFFEGAPIGRAAATHDGLWAAPAGAGPRHMEFGNDGRTVYVVNELGSSVSVFSYEPGKAWMKRIQDISTIPPSFPGPNAAADIRIHPNGRVLYASNRGHDSIAIFDIDPVDGRLSGPQLVPSGGEHPRNFAISPDGRVLLVANLRANEIVSFAADEHTGRLTRHGPVTPVAAPSCVVFRVP